MTDYLIVAAIDFGTTYSGFAFSTRNDFQRDPTNVYGRNWTASNLRSNKTATSILFNPEGEFEEFGFAAEDLYLDLAAEKQESDWYFFHRFKMQLFDKMAGIENDKLVIALEPEAAALFVKHLPIHKKTFGELGDSFEAFSAGSSYIVCDAGGGTVDVTVHEVLEDDKSVREINRPTGGNWGGTNVDDAFITILERIAGDKVMKAFQNQQKYDFMELLREFEVKKREINYTMKKKVTFKVPTSFKDAFEAENPGKSLSDITSEIDEFKDKIKWISDKMQFYPDLVTSLFDESINNICGHLSNIFSSNKVKDVNYILLIGGYAESPLLQNEMKRRFPSKRLIVPQEAGLSVLKGAVIFGHNPLLIRERIAKFTYGIQFRRPFIEGVDPEDSKTFVDGEPYCNNVFDIHIEADESMIVGEIQSEKKYGSNSKSTGLYVYASRENSPNYITDKGCFLLGKTSLDTNKEDDLEVQMSFSGTEIEAKISCKNTGHSRVVYINNS
ncbi:heat shock 70 kDa protein 12A-like isoform X2 [Saccostrea cucullata]|uniref:heat shock 70 kDa protein 12A-like isoform X2 n=1 Tax=Saccostrea cuccullata TaxID=36930 RepID=UPI002ED46FD8